MRVPSLASLLWLIALPLAAQQPAPSLPEKCSIEGMVVKAGTGEPLKKARLALGKAEGRGEQPPSALTDRSGRFLLKDIEPGRYRLWVERQGYVRQEYGQRGPNRPGTIISLAAGQRLRDIIFQLIPAAVIAGRVYDEDGEPLPGVHVQAQQYRYLRGQRQLISSEQAGTNDLGEYRLYGLAPGQYYVQATYTAGQRWISGSVSLGGSQPAPEESYAPTFYPGTNDPGRAVPLEVRPGDEVRGIDLTILRTLTVRVRGKVLNAVVGGPARGAMLWLTPRDPEAAFFFLRDRARIEDDGTFEIRGVAPGSYNLTADWFYDNKRYSARLQVDVGSTNIDGVNLVIAPGIDLAGRLRVEGAAPARSPKGEALDWAQLRVFLQPRDLVPMGSASASVKPDGSFVLQNVSPNSYRVGVFPLPADFYLKVARLGGEDALEEGFAVGGREPSGPLELVLSSGGAVIEGQVLNAEQQPFSGARVVLVPEPRRRTQERLYKNTTTDQYGRFTLRGVAPGDYKLFAWEDVEPGAYQDAEFLRPYEDRGEALRVQESGQHSVQLKLIPAGQPPR